VNSDSNRAEPHLADRGKGGRTSSSLSGRGQTATDESSSMEEWRTEKTTQDADMNWALGGGKGGGHDFSSGHPTGNDEETGEKTKGGIFTSGGSGIEEGEGRS